MGRRFAVHNAKRMGKTLTIVFIIIERLLNEPDIQFVVSNVNLDLTSIGMQHKFLLLDDIEKIKEIGGKDKYILFIDELRRYADSRLSGTQKNRFISNLLADLGKQRVDFYYTDQDSHAIDRRIKVNVDYVLVPYYDPRTRWCRVLCFHTLNEYDMFMMWNMGKPFYEYCYYAPKYFKFYNTEQKIDDYKIKFDAERYAQELAQWMKENNYGGEKIDYSMISLWNTTISAGMTGTERSALWKWIKLNDFQVKAENL